MLPCLETPDPHQLTLPGKRLSAKIEAVADADFFFFFFFFFLGGRDIHYKDAMKETTSVCEGHPQQKLQATRTT